MSLCFINKAEMTENRTHINGFEQKTVT